MSKNNVRLERRLTPAKGHFSSPEIDSRYKVSAPAKSTRKGLRVGRGKFRIFGHFVHAQFLILVAVEYLALAGAHYWSQTGTSEVLVGGLGGRITSALSFSSIFVLGLAVVGLYDGRQRERFAGLFSRMTLAFTFGLIAVNVLSVYGESLQYPAIANIAPPVSGLIIALLLLALIRIIFYRYVDGRYLLRRVLVLGVGKKARFIDQIRRKADMRGYELLGFIASKGCQHACVRPQNILNTSQNVLDYALDNDVDEIVVALDDKKTSLPEQTLLDCRMKGIAVIDVLDFFERERTVLHLDLMQPDWLIYAQGFNRSFVASFAKRGLDVFVSVGLLLVVAPVVILTALAITVESAGNGALLYRQKRVGKGGKSFTLLKFRSMVNGAESDGVARWASENDGRITRVGAFIRKYRIDEIPQLWNVLIGDMSIIGPRPERPEFVEKLREINPLYSARHTVEPGITGWAQLCFPYGASESDSMKKLQYDLYYVKNRSLFLDLYILAQTVEAVLFKKGAR